MKTFKFKAKQGQHNQIAQILVDNVGKPKLSRIENGVLIEVQLPEQMSKRFVDRLLFTKRVPGAVSRRNKYRVFAHNGWWDVYKIVDAIGRDVPFKAVVDGKFEGIARVHYHDYGCTCCGGFDYVEFMNNGVWRN